MMQNVANQIHISPVMPKPFRSIYIWIKWDSARLIIHKSKLAKT